MPPGPQGPSGRPAARCGDADRDRLVAVLREHYALGRFDLDEFSRRAEIVLSAEYADEAATALRDLPPLGPSSPRQGTGQRSGSGAGAGKTRRRRHAQSAAPGPGWVPTTERFRDPTSGAIMRVWLDPADQSRHYIPDPGA
jgi:hypothetical protein